MTGSTASHATAPTPLRAFLCAALLAAACTKTNPSLSGIGQPCVLNGDCAAGYLCADSRCALPANLGGCQPAALRCNGADVEACGADGLGWAHVSTCATGCAAGACRPQVCTPGAARCEGAAAEQCTPTGEAWAFVQICSYQCEPKTGVCEAKPPICTAGARRCNGNVAEQCGPNGDTWALLEACNYQCDPGTAACIPQPGVCTPGALRCDGDAAEQCAPSGLSWALVQVCATHCDPATNRCKAPVCAPFSARCDPSGASNVLVCDPFGGGYVVTACASTETCANGICVSGSARCLPGDLRCNGPDVQRCVALSPSITSWQTSGACLAGCATGACNPGGSCTSIALHPAASAAPLDGASTVLVYSEPIGGLDGVPLPDGTTFTVTATATTGTPPLVVSADADPAVDGVQVRSLGGRIHFAVRAPAGTADAVGTVTASLARPGTCTGSAAISFSAANTGALVAEDFTTAALRNATSTTADWNIDRGALIAATPIDVGDGADGPLAVSGNTNLSTDTNLMPAYLVTGLVGNVVTVAGNALSLSGGDEVLLWDAQGQGAGFGNAGNYEFARVASVSGAKVTLAAAPGGYYGAAADQDVSLQRIVLQRVPHLASLTVSPGATLSARPWNGSTGGLLFVRVAGAARIQGEVGMDGAGFRGGSGGATTGEDFSGQPSTAGASAGAGAGSCGGGYGGSGGCAVGGPGGRAYGSPLLGKLFLGSGGGSGSSAGGAGGGAIVIAASELRLDADSPATFWQGRVHADGAASAANSGGGSGGTVWLLGATAVLGTTPAQTGSLSANGGGSGPPAASGGVGRVRVDFFNTDLTAFGVNCARTLPACSFGVSGPLVGQSLDAYDVDPALMSTNLDQATLLAAVGTSPAGIISGAGFRVSAINTDPPQFSDLKQVGDTVVFVANPDRPQLGKRFRWRVEVSPPQGPPQQLLGVQWRLKLK